MSKLTKDIIKSIKEVKIKICKRCLKQYIGKHKCTVIETEAELIKRTGRY